MSKNEEKFLEKLVIEYIPLVNITPYENNARLHSDEDINAIVESIKLFGMNDPIGVWGEKNIIVEGHGRLMALERLGYEEAPCLRLDRLSEEERRAYALAHNKTAELSEWDIELLIAELESINTSDISMDAFKFEDIISIDVNDFEIFNVSEGSIFSREDEIESSEYSIPPLSVLFSTSGNWLKRKREWKELGIRSGLGRDDDLLKGLKDLSKRTGDNMSGTSIFDATLCETMYRWFNVDGGSVYDCFAGGSVRGIVAEKLGYSYTGIDLRQEQVDANYENAEDVGVNPVWICDDSQNADLYLEDESVDMVFSCPPYADLEVYSADPRDLSTMEYDKFIEIYTNIIHTACRKLKNNRFAVFVVGDIRDKHGFYRDFIGDTKRAFKNAGLILHNDMVFREAEGNAVLRAARTFNALRKVVKMHQNVLVFYKGDVKEISNNFTYMNVSNAVAERVQFEESKVKEFDL